MSKKKVVAGVVAGIVVAGGVVGGLNASKISAYYLKNFANPAKYYQYVEAENLKNAVTTYEALHKQYQEQLKQKYTDSSFELSAELSDLGKNQIMAMTGGVLPVESIDWFKSFKLSGVSNFTENSLAVDGKVAVNDTDLLSMNFAGDTGMATYVYKIPEISDKYLGVNLVDMGMPEVNDEIVEFLKAVTENKDVLPDHKKVENVLERYGKILVTSADDVKREKNVSVKAGEISVKTTKLTASWDGKDLADLSKEMMTSMKDDKDLEEIIKSMDKLSVTAGAGMEEEFNYESFKSTIEEELNDFNEDDYKDSSFDMTIYVDGQNKVVGRDFSANKKEVLSYKMPMNKDDFALDLVLMDSDEDSSLGLKGNGKITKASLTGDFQFLSNDVEVVKVNLSKYDLEKAKKGQADMEFTLIPAQIMATNAQADMMKSYSMQMKLSGDNKEATLEVIPLYQEEALGKIVLKSALAEAKDIVLPSGEDVILVSASGQEAFDWVKTFSQDKFDALKEKLKSAGLPENYVMIVEQGYAGLQQQIAFMEEMAQGSYELAE